MEKKQRLVTNITALQQFVCENLYKGEKVFALQGMGWIKHQ